MNYLAHILLARHSDEAMLGALLGDFVKIADTHSYPPDIARDIVLHRQVDEFTDSHPVVLAGKAMFAGPERRFAGILLDVFYDHVLASQWARYSDVPLDAFIARFYAALERHRDILPERLQQMLPWLIGEDWLGSYREFAGVDTALRRIATRLSKNGHLLTDGIAGLQTHHAALADGFADFFPQLQDFVARTRASHTG